MSSSLHKERHFYSIKGKKELLKCIDILFKLLYIITTSDFKQLPKTVNSATQIRSMIAESYGAITTTSHH